MIEVFEQNQQMLNRNSSKGNQLKWEVDGLWYKADNIGYEGLAEYVISNLLLKSSLCEEEFVVYDTEEVRYKKQVYKGCSSRNFLPKGYQIITLERLFEANCEMGLHKSLFLISKNEERIKFLVQQVERITGLIDFGKYMVKLLTIDALFLNEDRHTHNIAVLLDESGEYHLCPIFDNGGALLSDVSMDYPLSEDVYSLIKQVRAKTFSQSFDEQLDAVEKVYGNAIHFYFSKKDVEEIINKETNYPVEIKERVKEVIFAQMSKYEYLFK